LLPNGLRHPEVKIFGFGHTSEWIKGPEAEIFGFGYTSEWVKKPGGENPETNYGT
jgi:hypothetical protein